MGVYILQLRIVVVGDKLTFRCAKCGKEKVVGEVSLRRPRTHIRLYFCSNECARALTKALPARAKRK